MAMAVLGAYLKADVFGHHPVPVNRSSCRVYYYVVYAQNTNISY